jgi:multiple sugar transport system permease protein
MSATPVHSVETGTSSRPVPSTAGPGRPRSMSKGVVNAVLVIGVLYTLFPLVWMLLATTKNASGLLGGGVFNLDHFDLAGNLRSLATMDHGIYFRWYLNSILYAGVGSVVCSLICVAAGYAFDKYHFVGKEKLFGLVLVGVLVPGAATTLPLYLLASQAHLVNTVWAVLIPSLVNPFGVYLGRVFSSGYVPNEVLEAARIDGAGELRIFRTIGLSMLKPGFITILLFQFSAIWNSFYLPYVMLNDSKLFPVSLGLYLWNSQVASEDPLLITKVITGSVLAIIPVVILFLCLQRYWRSGLTAGAVK